MNPVEPAMWLDDLAPVGLDELNAVAALQTRVDRKYIVTPGQLDGLIGDLASRLRVLDIAGRRRFAYESRYFDTPSLDSFLGAARRRPRRFKVRTRSYLDTAACWVEVKLRSPRGQTIKHRLAHDFADRERLTDDSRAFVASFPALAALADRFVPTLTTTYRRSTFVIGSSRITVDAHVTCTALSALLGDDGRVATFGDALVIESKSVGGSCDVDRALWAMGVRPVPVSKYGTGLAALNPELPANKWHRVLTRHVSA